MNRGYIILKTPDEITQSHYFIHINFIQSAYFTYLCQLRCLLYYPFRINLIVLDLIHTNFISSKFATPHAHSFLFAFRDCLLIEPQDNYLFALHKLLRFATSTSFSLHSATSSLLSASPAESCYFVLEYQILKVRRLVVSWIKDFASS